MLSSSYYNSSSLHPLYNRHPISVFSISSSSLLPRHRPQDSPDSPTGDTTPDFFPPSEPISRTHNAKTTSLLSRHLLRESPVPQHWDEFQSHDEVFPLEEHVKRHELSLIATRRAPTFPGSISSYRPDVSTSPLQALFPRCDENEDEDIIIKAVEIRRKVTAEIFLQAMNKGKFGLTYSGNLAAKLGDFLDFVMIQAAHMWLKHNELSYPKIAKLLNMSRGNLDSVRRIAEWLKSIHVKGEFLGPVLTKAGDNVLERSNEELDEIVEYFMDEIRTRVKFFTDMGMNEKDFGTMVFEYSRVLGYFSLDEMNQKVRFFQDIGIEDAAIGNMLVKFPPLLTYSLQKKIRAVVIYLMTRAGVSQTDIAKVIASGPELMGCSIVHKLDINVKYFLSLGIRPRVLGEMVADFPMLLRYSVQVLRPKYQYLRRTMVGSLHDVIEYPRLDQTAGSSVIHLRDE
ncbi:Transcription termination factor MTERF2, chloroplastic [Linum perenne]